MATASDGEALGALKMDVNQYGDVQSPPQQSVAPPEPSSTASKHSKTSPIVQNLIKYGLQFLSTASSEALAICTLGLGIVIYIVLGRVGLVLIGTIGGILIHATWGGVVESGGDDEVKSGEIRRKEAGLDVVNRVLNWRHNQGGIVFGDSDFSIEVDGSQRQESFTDFQPSTGAALNRLIDAVIRDYVQ